MPRTYTVKKDDNLLELAKKFGISYSALLSANAGVSSVSPGVTLSIPGTTQLSGVDPKSPWTPDLPQPDPKDPIAPPYVPPEPKPDLPEWFPEKREPRPPGAVDPKGPWTPDLPQPAPIQPPPVQQPPVVGVTGAQPLPRSYLPPARSMAELEARRVQQPPVVGVTGAGPVVEQPPVVSLTGAQPQPRRSLGESIFGVDLSGNKARDIMRRLFNVRPPSLTPDAASPFFESFRQGNITDPTTWGALWQGIQERNRTAREEGRPSTYTGGAVGQIAREAAGIPGTGISTGFGDLGVAYDGWESSVNQAATAKAQGQERGVQWYRMLMGEGREDRMFAYVWDEKTPQEELLKQRAGHVADSLNRGDFPQIILESDRRLMKYSTEDMDELGYVWDEEKGHWIFGGAIEEPQTYGASLPGWGYNYPSYRRGGGGGGGGGYSYPSYLPKEQGPYPQSFLDREQGPYPQSFVGREQPGGIPGLAQIRAARFGAITWRI